MYTTSLLVIPVVVSLQLREAIRPLVTLSSVLHLLVLLRKRV